MAGRTPLDAAHGELPQRLGFTVLEADGKKARGRLVVDAGLLQAGGVLHGGALFALADAVAASLAMAVDPRAAGATVEASIRFFRPATQGAVEAEASVLHRGRRTLVLSVRLADAEGRLLALTTTTYLRTETR